MAQTSRISEYEQAAADGMSSAQEWATEMVESQPLTSVLAVFATGFILGAGIATALTASASRSRRHLPQQLDTLSNRIAEAVSGALPKNLLDMWHK